MTIEILIMLTMTVMGRICKLEQRTVTDFGIKWQKMINLSYHNWLQSANANFPQLW